MFLSVNVETSYKWTPLKAAGRVKKSHRKSNWFSLARLF